MIHRLISVIIIMLVLILGLNYYLTPDDLADCPKPASGGCVSADAIVTVSGGDTDARTDEAIKLYKNGWAPQLIMSGAAADKSGLSNAAAMKKRAISRGVAAENILIEEKSETTNQNAVEVKKLLANRKVKRIILVTSRYHMRRTQLEFAAQLEGIEVISHPVHSDKDWGAAWWLTPWGWWLALGELVKIIVFAAGGLS